MGALLCKFIFSMKEPKKILVLHGAKSNAIDYMQNYLKLPIAKTKITHPISVCTYKDLSVKLRSKTIDKEILIVTFNYDSIRKIPDAGYCSSSEFNEVLMSGDIFHYKISLLEEAFLTKILQLEDIINSNNYVDDLVLENRFNQLFMNPKLNIYSYKTEYMKFHYSTEEIMRQLDYSKLTEYITDQSYIKPETIDKIFGMLSDIFKMIHVMLNGIPPNSFSTLTECSNIFLFYNSVPSFTKLSDTLKLISYRNNELTHDSNKLNTYNQILIKYLKEKTPTPVIVQEMLQIPPEKNNNILILFGLLFNHLLKSPINCDHDFIIMNFN
jgi:hypothetical protein